MNSVFNEQILADKLSKLNGTQQCIETLSHWCIFHRNKAELVVQTWSKQFHSSQQDQKVPFLYLANDILQNSKRKGTEFVSEFWKVLPAALKDVVENGDEHGKNVVSRLVGIWEERRVFGSRAKGLNNLMLGEETPPTLELNNSSSKKRSRSIKIVKRDSRSIRIKLSIGGAAEKIVSAFHSVNSDHPDEDADLNKCKASVNRVAKLEKDVNTACSKSVEDPQRVTLANDLLDEESLLKECIDKLKSVEATRAVLVSHLKETLQEQESELENVRTQLQVAQTQVGEAENMRRRLRNDPIITSTSNPPTTASNAPTETSKRTAASIAAEVADKLTASTSSQQIMTSVLSTFAAEAVKNASLSDSSRENRKPETPIPISTPTMVQMRPPPPMIQSSSPISQTQYTIFPAPPTQQYLQPPTMLQLPYTFNGLLPPLPLPAPPPQQSRPQQMLGLVPPNPSMAALQQPMPLAQQPGSLTLQMAMALQQPAPPPSYRPLQPPSLVFYGRPPSHNDGR
ncbi:hypothetical protein QJS10_CPB18g01263 [Acorus calamus]|uniref:CID domain-containing protein n=1 Tax=Acorus calamus TaxID=4465 RepID=A0AAV9CNV4_ACOCL|nr:hypothetical protein QJS10_CPB18g01263 [Acorus calamus]